MSLTRKMLKAMGIEEEKVDQIIEAHTETVESIKNERDEYKSLADKVPELEEKISDLTTQVQESGKDSWKVKYENIKADFDSYKKEILDKEILANKTTAYKTLLKEVGISEKRLDSILKVSNLNSFELDEKGKIKESGKLKESLKNEWSDFIVSEGKSGAETSNPPGNNGANTFATMSLADKMTYANDNPKSAEVIEWLKQ